MTLHEAFDILPLSEKTLIRHDFLYKGLGLLNDLGHPCEYRVLEGDNVLGMVKYYKGRLLACYEIRLIERTTEVGKVWRIK